MFFSIILFFSLFGSLRRLTAINAETDAKLQAASVLNDTSNE